MRTVKEVNKTTGVSVRTLQYYDNIGLLKPTEINNAGYRLYDDIAIKNLENILMFRELKFPLKEIKKILNSTMFNPDEALTHQIKLLELQRKHIDELISLAYKIKKEGVNKMDFNVFNKNEFNQYAEEVKAKWGSTKQYEEYTEKTKQKSNEEFKSTENKLMDIFADIGKIRKLSPGNEEVQEKIRLLQKFITDNYYVCTNEVLNGLGQMYVGDERMKNNIDKVGGEGTAEFVKQAILIYCSK